jgi:hypothetical protein
MKEFAVGEDYNKITLIKQYIGERLSSKSKFNLG